jgi:hypothetical protein
VASARAARVLLIDGLTYAASVAMLAGLRLPRPGPRERTSFAGDLRDGWREVRARTWAWLSTRYFAVFKLAVAAIDVLGPALVSRRARAARGPGGAIAAALSAGQLLGSSAALRLRTGR